MTSHAPNPISSTAVAGGPLPFADPSVTAAPPNSPAAPPPDRNKEISDTYNSLESRIAWDLLCGGNRHYGYWDKDTKWPFPLSKGQRRMQEKLLEVLNLPPSSKILDVGCGDGHVAIDLAMRGDFEITAFDVVDRHVENARRNVKKARLGDKVQIEKMDFASLETLPEGSFDGVYTSESLLHAGDIEKALRGLLRVLRPGGHLVLHEYHNDFMKGNIIGFPAVVAKMEGRGQGVAFPRAERFFRDVVARAGFESVEVRNYSDNIEPMARLLNISAAWRHVVLALHLKRFFPNSAAREEGYVGQQHWAYVSVFGRKPMGGAGLGLQVHA
ncbi:hypothetical protein OQA88_10750 [Cercophora sp. LCS_1]